MRNGASEASWIPRHADCREKRRQNWTKDERGNHLADKVADGNVAAVTAIHPHVQWTTVAAITAMASLPGKGELYVGDYRGHPKALHGIMEAVHEIRHDRYLTRRDCTNGDRFYWQDNTIALAANIFNGSSKSTGHHAHTTRMLYDKHWHGRNRTKDTKLPEEERSTEAACHLWRDRPQKLHTQ